MSDTLATVKLVTYLNTFKKQGLRQTLFPEDIWDYIVELFCSLIWYINTWEIFNEHLLCEQHRYLCSEIVEQEIPYNMYHRGVGYLKVQIPHLVRYQFHCNCCLSHQIHKANFISSAKDGTEQLIIMTKPDVFLNNIGNKCDCDCRFLTRKLARVWVKLQVKLQNLNPNMDRDHSLFIEF